MRTLSKPLFEQLKNNVLEIAGIADLNPAGTKFLAHAMYVKTKKPISETTLKRVYGFASTAFNPSYYTLDAMACYCGHSSWQAFCDRHNESVLSNPAEQRHWSNLRRQAMKVTGHTLAALKNRSGIPYPLTIGRRFISDHMQEFSTECYNATAFIAPSGYGKTIGLCHWVEDQLAAQADGANDDIVLFFSAGLLMKSYLSGRDLSEWLLILLGYGQQQQDGGLADAHLNACGNFYLVIDGLDEHKFKNEQFHHMLEQLMMLCSAYLTNNWFKLVLSVQTASWLNNRHLLAGYPQHWFLGFATNSGPDNVPLFSFAELKELENCLNPGSREPLPLEAALLFNYPLFLQYFYQQDKRLFSLNKADETLFYDAVANFVLNKVYLGTYAEYKFKILTELTRQIILRQTGYPVSKLLYSDLLKKHSAAYHELISAGLLTEINTSHDHRFNVNIYFSNEHFLSYFTARRLLSDHAQCFGEEVIGAINQELKDQALKMPVLKWCMLHAIRNGQQESLGLLPKTELDPKDKSELILFLGKLLGKTSLTLKGSESLANFFGQDCSDDLFSYLFGFEFISADYREPLEAILRFQLADSKKILVHTALGVIAILQLDMISLERQIGLLSCFQEEAFGPFPVHPVRCLTAILQFFKHGYIDRDYLQTLTRFYIAPPQFEKGSFLATGSALICQLGAFSMLISAKPRKMLRFCAALEAGQRSGDGSVAYVSFFNNILASDAYFKLGKFDLFLEKQQAITQSILKEAQYTNFMHALFTGMKIKRAVTNGAYAKVQEYLKGMEIVCKRSGNKFSQLFIMLVLINDAGMDRQQPLLYRQINYNLRKLVRQCGLDSRLLTKSPAQQFPLIRS